MSFRALVLSAVLCCVLARTAPRPQLNDHWEIYKNVHNKKYGQGEEHVRRLIWEDNLDFIQKHNIEYDLGLRTHTVAVNSLADLTSEEYRQVYLGYRYNKTTKTAVGVHKEASMYDLPEEVDWRPKGYVTPIKNQQNISNRRLLRCKNSVLCGISANPNLKLFPLLTVDELVNFPCVYR